MNALELLEIAEFDFSSALDELGMSAVEVEAARVRVLTALCEVLT